MERQDGQRIASRRRFAFWLGDTDDVAYALPMVTFLVLVWIGTQGNPTPAGNSWYPLAYTSRALLVGWLLWRFRRFYAPINWRRWWIGIPVGIAGVFLWLGMQTALERQFEYFRPSGSAFNPELYFEDPAMRWAFVAVRLFGAVAVVPLMEELFWRDYAWRVVIAGNEFRKIPVGTWDWRAFVAVPVFFCLVHGNWWLTAIIWAFMIGGLLVWTRSLGACVVAHAVTNLLLGLYVLATKNWSFW